MDKHAYEASVMRVLEKRAERIQPVSQNNWQPVPKQMNDPLVTVDNTGTKEKIREGLNKATKKINDVTGIKIKTTPAGQKKIEDAVDTATDKTGEGLKKGVELFNKWNRNRKMKKPSTNTPYPKTS